MSVLFVALPKHEPRWIKGVAYVIYAYCLVSDIINTSHKQRLLKSFNLLMWIDMCNTSGLTRFSRLLPLLGSNKFKITALSWLLYSYFSVPKYQINSTVRIQPEVESVYKYLVETEEEEIRVLPILTRIQIGLYRLIRKDTNKVFNE